MSTWGGRVAVEEWDGVERRRFPRGDGAAGVVTVPREADPLRDALFELVDRGGGHARADGGGVEVAAGLLREVLVRFAAREGRDPGA